MNIKNETRRVGQEPADRNGAPNRDHAQRRMGRQCVRQDYAGAQRNDGENQGNVGLADAAEVTHHEYWLGFQEPPCGKKSVHSSAE